MGSTEADLNQKSSNIVFARTPKAYLSFLDFDPETARDPISITQGRQTNLSPLAQARLRLSQAGRKLMDMLFRRSTASGWTAPQKERWPMCFDDFKVYDRCVKMSLLGWRPLLLRCVMTCVRSVFGCIWRFREQVAIEQSLVSMVGFEVSKEKVLQLSGLRTEEVEEKSTSTRT